MRSFFFLYVCFVFSNNTDCYYSNFKNYIFRNETHQRSVLIQHKKVTFFLTFFSMYILLLNFHCYNKGLSLLYFLPTGSNFDYQCNRFFFFCYGKVRIEVTRISKNVSHLPISIFTYTKSICSSFFCVTHVYFL